jgi:hypothetical protein
MYSKVSTSPAIPTIIKISPTVVSEIPETLVVTA